MVYLLVQETSYIRVCRLSKAQGALKVRLDKLVSSPDANAMGGSDWVIKKTHREF